MVLDFENTPQKEWTANNWADHYRYNWGVNCVPSNGCQMFKGEDIPHGNVPEPWKEWQDKPIPLELHEKWKKENKFDHGIMRITGPVWHNEKFKDYIYSSLDCDNYCAIEEFIPGGPIDNSQKGVIEMHLGTSNKCHWEFFINKNSTLKSKASDATNPKLKDDINNNNIPSFEIKTGNGVMFGAPSKHPDSTRYEFLGLNIPKLMNGDKIQEKVESVYKKYNMITNQTGDNKITVSDMVQPGVVIQEGHDRSQGILRFVDSLSRRLSPLQLDDSYFIKSAFWFAKQHTTPGYSDDKIMSTAIQAIQFIKKQRVQEDDMTYKRVLSGEIEEGLVEDCIWLVNYMINNLKIINKGEITAKINKWFLRVLEKKIKYEDQDDSRYNGIITSFKMDPIIKDVFNGIDVIESLKKLAAMYGQLKEPILLTKDQHLEAAIYIVERYNVKRHGLDGRLIYFNEIHYDDKTEAFLNKHIQHLMIRPKTVDLKEVYNIIKIESQKITLEEMRKHSHMICLLNGTYNIKTREFSTIFSPDYYIFDQIPYNYNPDQKFPEIKKFVTQLIPDKIDREFYYDFTSMCFHPYNGIYFQLGFIGPAGTGKSQLNKLTEKCFDEDSVHDARIQRISDDSTIRVDVALDRLNVDGDMTDLGIKEISNTKKFISQEAFTDRPVYDHSDKYYPSTRLMFSANSLYEISNKDDADAIYDRTKLIRFSKKFRHTTQDVKDYVDNKIPKQEFDGYVTFLLNNASDIWENKNTKNKLNPAEARDIWNELGNFIRQFIKKYLVKDIHSTVKALDIKDKWEEYTLSNNIEKSYTSVEFYKMVEEITGRDKEKIRLHDDVKSNVVWGYHGLRLRTDNEIESNEQTHLN